MAGIALHLLARGHVPELYLVLAAAGQVFPIRRKGQAIDNGVLISQVVNDWRLAEFPEKELAVIPSRLAHGAGSVFALIRQHEVADRLRNSLDGAYWLGEAIGVRHPAQLPLLI